MEIQKSKVRKFLESCNSPKTAKIYEKGIGYVFGSLDEADAWVERPPAEITDRVMAYILEAKKTTKPVTLATYIAAVKSFTDQYMVLLPWKQIRRQVGPIIRVAKDIATPMDEIRGAHHRGNFRARFILTALVSLGGRVGAFYFPLAQPHQAEEYPLLKPKHVVNGRPTYGYLRMKDLEFVDVQTAEAYSWTHWRELKEGQCVTRATVYRGEAEEYQPFFSTEATDNLLVYLKKREEVREELNPFSPVVRDVWDYRYIDGSMKDRLRPEIAHPLTEAGLESYMAGMWGRKTRATEGGFKTCHGLRKRFETETMPFVGKEIPGWPDRKNAFVAERDIDLLMGHNYHYYKPGDKRMVFVFLLLQPVLLVDEKYAKDIRIAEMAKQAEEFEQKTKKELEGQILQERVERLALREQLREQGEKLKTKDELFASLMKDVEALKKANRLD